MSNLRPYKEFIEKMKNDNYVRKNNDSTIIEDSNDMFTKYVVKKDTIGKFLELTCPENTVITFCGKKMICEKEYEFKIKCYDDEMREPFKDPIRSSLLVSKKTKKSPGILVNFQMIITKIGDKIYEIEPGWEKLIGTTLKIINSKNSNESPLWSGVYNSASYSAFVQGFYLKSDEKLVFYAVNPDIDIKNVILTMEIDIFEKNSN